MEIIGKACCFTGHRVVPKNEVSTLNELLLLEVLRKYREKNIKHFICGGAKGFDTIAGYVTLKAKKYYPDIKLHMFLPCPNQDDGWHLNDKILFERLQGLSDSVRFTSENYENGCMHRRNRAMVDESNVCIAYYKDRSGGTKYTIDYAKNNGIEVVNMVTQLESSIF